ncbi:hypothetical protein M9Y10_042361 [Tritrichomonas musculus]|uniref:non-specific serine/threonine protein kinase n=1 Tax=Tritrichomonas musculus TaxID=1915356 RepID=A0ABR2GP51_9EUKA
MDDDKTRQELFKVGTHIEDYVIVGTLGHGGYAFVYQVIDPATSSLYAMKIEPYRPNRRGLDHEIKILKFLNDDYFPKVIKDGKFNEYQYLVMNEFLPSINDVRKAHNDAFDSVAAFHVSLEMLKIIGILHQKGLLHLDIKPSNFMMNLNEDVPIVLIDFGFAMPIKNANTNVSSNFVGTRRYASINCHKKRPLGRCDDLISWFYVFWELLSKNLPWKDTKTKEEALKMKEDVIGDLSEYSKNLAKIYEYLINLQPTDEPDYGYVQFLMRSEMEKQNVTFEFDWLNFIQSETQFIKMSSMKRNRKLSMQGECDIC